MHLACEEHQLRQQGAGVGPAEYNARCQSVLPTFAHVQAELLPLLQQQLTLLQQAHAEAKIRQECTTRYDNLLSQMFDVREQQLDGEFCLPSSRGSTDQVVRQELGAVGVLRKELQRSQACTAQASQNATAGAVQQQQQQQDALTGQIKVG